MKFLKTLALPVVLFVLAGHQYPANAATITKEQWSRPRSGDMIVSLPQVRQLIARLDRFPGRHLELQFNRGDDGVLWVEELKAWLIALGVPSDRIVQIPGLPGPGAVEIRIGSGSTLK